MSWAPPVGKTLSHAAVLAAGTKPTRLLAGDTTLLLLLLPPVGEWGGKRAKCMTHTGVKWGKYQYYASLWHWWDAVLAMLIYSLLELFYSCCWTCLLGFVNWCFTIRSIWAWVLQFIELEDSGILQSFLPARSVCNMGYCSPWRSYHTFDCNPIHI